MYFPFQYALTPSKFVLLIALALKMTIYPKICQNHCLRMQKAHFRLTCVAQERLFLISSLMFLVSDRLLSLCRRDIAGCTSGYIGKILETVPLAMSERYCRLYHGIRLGYVTEVNTPRRVYVEQVTAYCRLLCNIKLAVLHAFSIVFIRDIFPENLSFVQTK